MQRGKRSLLKNKKGGLVLSDIKIHFSRPCDSGARIQKQTNEMKNKVYRTNIKHKV